MDDPFLKRLSPAYWRALAAAREHHATSKTYSGKFLRPHAPAILQLIEEHGCSSVLDYGCGKGAQYEWVSHGGPDQSIPEGMTLERFWGVTVRKYDPAWPPFSAEPVGTFDLVLCTHTLGSIPLQDLPVIVDRLYALTRKVLYVAEKLGPVQKQVRPNPEEHPNGWSREDWARLLHRPGPKVCILSTRERTAQGTIVTRSAVQ